MKENQNISNSIMTYNEEKSKENSVEKYRRPLVRKSTCPNFQSSHSLKYMESKFPNYEIKESNTKKRKSKRAQRLSIEFIRKYELENSHDQEMPSIMGVKKKFQNSLIFTGRKLKEHIETKLSNQMLSDFSNTNLDNTENGKKNEGNKSTNISNISLNSLVKRNIQKSIQNKNIKKRRRLSNEKMLLKEKNRRIFQIKHVYDSLEDSEDNINSCEESSYFISPETKFIYFYDFIIVICLAICIIYIPLKISFHKNSCISLNLVDIITFDFIDIIFIIDFLIGFYRGYYNSEYKLITNIKDIIKNYFSTYFIYDLISAFPCCSFLIYYYNDICMSYSNNNKYLFILVISFLKIFKCVKIKKNNKFIESISELFSKNFLAEQFYGIMKMALITFSILHILACCHLVIGFHFYPSWLFMLKDKNSVNSSISIYISSLYFLITTLTTVGYGDIVCISFPERIFQIIELALGVIFYSYIISKLGDYVKTESYATMVYNNNSAILEEIRITHPKMPFKLYNQILHHLQTNFQQQKKSDINLLINSLPHALKYTILFIINKNYVDHFYFFKKCYNSNFIAYSLIHFVPISYKKNTLIIKEDQLIDNAIFIIEGRLSLEISIDLENPEQSIKKYLNKNYNPLKNENKNGSNLHEKITTIDFENKKTGINEIKSLITKYSDIMKEKGLDFSKIEKDFDESNYQFLNISTIFKNEHYGEVFIILNKPSPLFLRVKSKKVNLFLLNKKHILHLSENFANIWKRIFQKSLKNMRAFKQKTIEVAKKYSLTYNVGCLEDIMNNKRNNYQINVTQNKELNDNNNNNHTSINKVRFSLKDFISKDILDIEKSTNKLENYKSHLEKIEEKEGKEEKEREGKEEREEKEEKEEKEKKEEKKEEIKEIKENKKNEEILNKKNKDISKFFTKNYNNFINRKKSKKLNNKSKTIDFRQQNINIFGKEKARLFRNISNKFVNAYHYSLKNFDSNYINTILLELRKEIDKRNRYLKLFNESNKKIKNLYSQLVNDSIDLSNNIDKLGYLDTQICDNLDISKIVLNNINNASNMDSPNPNNKKENNININNCFSLNSKKTNKIDKKSSNSLNSNKKSKTNFKNKGKKQISKFNINNKSQTEQIFINLNQPLLIFNSCKTFNNRDDYNKDETNIYNKFMTLINKSNYLDDKNISQNYIKDNILNNKDNKEKKLEINLSSYSISDNSHNSILNSKFKENLKIGEEKEEKNKK